MHGLDVVGCLGLLDCQAEEGSEVIPHEPQAGARPRVVELTAAEALPLAAAVQADRPIVVARRRLGRAVRAGDRERCDAVGVQILEGHGVPQVQLRAVGEEDSACVHELLPPRLRRVDAGVDVEVQDVIEGLHVAEVVGVAEDGAQHPCQQAREEDEDVPSWVAALVPLPDRVDGPIPEDEHQHEDAPQAHVARLRLRVVELERQQDVGRDEDRARDHEREEHRQHVRPPLAASEGHARSLALHVGLREGRGAVGLLGLAAVVGRHGVGVSLGRVPARHALESHVKWRGRSRGA
mmetsp:Transcript_2233/g.4988  ORF Transcript_2233/g.4988 Transcript_2233/m.4988 type:complete len:294 (+) Transcript_2233:2-883(+)